MKNTIAVFNIAIIFTLFFSHNSTAQHSFGVRPYSKDTSLGFGFSMGIPTNYVFNSVMDADIRLQKDFSPYVSGLLNLGCTYFLSNGKTIGSEYGENIGFFPIKVGAKVFPLEKVYISGEFGVAFRTTAKQPKSLIYAPGIGMEFKNGLDIGLRYENFSKYEMAKVALKVAFEFTLNREMGYRF